jgi:hypothetical protein
MERISLPNMMKSNTTRIPICKCGGYERKEIALTPGGLTRVPDKRDGISHRNKPVSDGRLNCKKSAEAIVVQRGRRAEQ